MKESEIDINALSMKQIKKFEQLIAKKNAYFPINRLYAYFPYITGIPTIEYMKRIPFVGRTELSNKPALGVYRTTKTTKYRKIINYPWSKLGALQVAVVGTLGTGKSNLIHLTTALLAARGVKILTFNDRCFEARTLAAHGWFDNRGNFHPFQVNVWIPEGYKFNTSAKAHNPLWKHRDNVELMEFNEVGDIIETMDRGVITVVYDDAFDKASKIRLLIDLFNKQSEYVRIGDKYMFVHHELSTLIPENARKDTYALVQDFSDILVTSRRNMLGLLTSFHMTTEVFYRTVQKFAYTLFKRTTNRKFQARVEHASRSLAINEVNVSFAGNWTKHTIGYFPELPDKYRLAPNRNTVSYPKEEESTDEKKDTVEIDPVDFAICQLRAQGLTWKEIGRRVGKSTGSVYYRASEVLKIV